jgi:SAM-dependent methyltransferase
MSTEVELYSAFRDFSEYEASQAALNLPARLTVEGALARAFPDCITAHCVLCGELRHMAFTPILPPALPNWREELTCDGCGLICRLRFALGWLIALDGADTAGIYITEQVTPAYLWLRRHIADVVGSEFLTEGNAPRLADYLSTVTDGEVALRHEDVTSLTFGDGERDVVISFEVLEHVPDYLRALCEFHRVLAPGGTLLITVPFNPSLRETLVRARMKGGVIEHVLEPEYHGDPAGNEGCLAYYVFGWSLLDELRSIGFIDVGLLDGWSPATAHLGFIGAIIATKA